MARLDRLGEDEIGDIAPRDPFGGSTFEVIYYTIVACPGPIGEARRPDYQPVDVPGGDDLLLAVLVCINRFQKQWLEDSIVKKTTVTF